MGTLDVSATNSKLPEFSVANQYLNEVAREMGALGQYAVTEYDPNPVNMYMQGNNKMRIGKIMADVLNGDSTEFIVQSALGVMAHELAHRILKHHERINAFLLESQGIPVKSLDDLIEVLSGNIPKTHSGKSLFIDFHNWASRQTPESIDQLKNSLSQNNPEFYRNIEREADLLTMRDSYLARGLRDHFVKVIEDCEKTLKPHCNISYVDGKKHPSTVSRIHYMTRALCNEYPEENKDICPDRNVAYRSNATCPVVDLCYRYPK
jgi:hypothetical protein